MNHNWSFGIKRYFFGHGFFRNEMIDLIRKEFNRGLLFKKSSNHSQTTLLDILTFFALKRQESLFFPEC